MAGALSIVGLVVSTTSVLSSVVAAFYSSAYESERTLREFKELRDELDKLNECLRVLSDHEPPSQSEASWPGERECRTLLRGASSAAAHLPSRFREMTEYHESVAFVRCLEPIEAHCRQQTKYTPIFWRLQSWITKIGMDHLPSSARTLFTIPSIEHPTPRGLLLSWIVLAIATATYYRSRSGFQHEGYYLVGSIMVACVVGMLEGSGIATVVLLDIPWCITGIGMLLHMVVRGASKRLRARRIWRNDVSCGLPPMVLSQDVEKMAGK